MSSWMKLEPVVNDLKALEEASHNMGFKTERNAVARGGYGKREFDLVIKLPGVYDVGVSRKAGLSRSYELNADLDGGNVARSIGVGAGLLMQAYGLVVAKKTAEAAGYQVQQTKLVDGTIKLTVQQY